MTITATEIQTDECTREVIKSGNESQPEPITSSGMTRCGPIAFTRTLLQQQ